MAIDLTNLKARAKSRRKDFKKTFDCLEKLGNSKTDNMIQTAHDKVFECLDCLSCANCCKTTGPLITKRDISRISTYLNISVSDFETKYLKVDEDEDFVLQVLPCPFLDLNTNMCGIYDVRPKACADFPLTGLNNQIKMKNLTLKNAGICPGVYEILDKMSSLVKK